MRTTRTLHESSNTENVFYISTSVENNNFELHKFLQFLHTHRTLTIIQHNFYTETQVTIKFYFQLTEFSHFFHHLTGCAFLSVTYSPFSNRQSHTYTQFKYSKYSAFPLPKGYTVKIFFRKILFSNHKT